MRTADAGLVAGIHLAVGGHRVLNDKGRKQLAYRYGYPLLIAGALRLLFAVITAFVLVSSSGSDRLAESLRGRQAVGYVLWRTGISI